MIKVKNVTKKLGVFEIKNISFEVNQGEYLVILGPTGAGKTIIL
ncbi:ATP-binding cassette domain-containing protein, partial [bacterium]|nr:ATP-binding cassette domain-containing protein [bacterium]